MHLKLKKRKVIDFLNSGFSERDAAKKFGVGKGTISRIKNNKQQSSINSIRSKIMVRNI